MNNSSDPVEGDTEHCRGGDAQGDEVMLGIWLG